jgi:hypothetical protein
MVMLRRDGKAFKIAKKILKKNGRDIQKPIEKPVPKSYLTFSQR